MKIILNALVLMLFSLALSSCLDDDGPVAPTVIVDPPARQLIAGDTIREGSYLGLTVGENAQNSYTAVKALEDLKGVMFLNVVGNFFTDVTELEERLPLYHLLFLNEKEGSSSGVQMAFEDEKVKSIFLNNGKQLNQWPMGFSASSAVETGDSMEELYKKLLKISNDGQHKSKFERMLLLTKYVSKQYDPRMGESPQWYFSYTLEEDKMDEVMLNFKNGVLTSIYVYHFQSY